jgi:hypothetical protein
MNEQQDDLKTRLMKDGEALRTGWWRASLRPKRLRYGELLIIDNSRCG